ncbi:MAG: hypothetical protein AAGF01_07745, partial [Cyanobacteria bacterium P01_G01_bin.38]
MSSKPSFLHASEGNKEAITAVGFKRDDSYDNPLIIFFQRCFHFLVQACPPISFEYHRKCSQRTINLLHLYFMKVEKAKEYINKRLVAQGRQLLDAEILVLRAAWDDLTYEQVAKEAGYKLPSLRSGTAPKLFNRISGIVGEKVTKKTFRPILTKHISAQKPQDSYLRRSDTHPQPAIDTVSTKSKIKNIIGAQPAINPKFYGRTEALQALKQGIELHKCVLLVGTEGVGKRSLLARLLQSTPLPFSQIIWKPVLHAPTVESLEDELLQLFPTQDTSLMTLFTQQKYLLVLESIDSLLECSGSSKILHRGYISFIRRIIEETRSHVVLISNESIPQ